MIVEEDGREIWSVADLVTYVYHTLDADENLKSIWVEGEISNFSQHSKSKHMYFTLKDDQARIKAAMFESNNRRLRFTPKNGDRVMARGTLSLYEAEGQIQFYVKDMRASGMGDLFVAFQQLKERLQEEGLFDRPKKPIPLFPQVIGVITSPTGAAVQDILTTLHRRYPLARVLVDPVSVQGEKAAQEIASAIDRMNERKEVDLLIIGRGGGSIEELWAFNEEIVARSIFRSSLPIISAVGHETDTTISDFVADYRAATPTAAAEMAVPHIQELRSRVAISTERLLHVQYTLLQEKRREWVRQVERAAFQKPQARLQQYMQRLYRMQADLEYGIDEWVAGRRGKIEQLQAKLQAFHPAERVRYLRERLERLQSESNYHVEKKLREQVAKRDQLISKLDALSPLKVMQRGYSLVYRYKGEELIKSHRQVQPGDLIRVQLAEGELKCQVWKAEGKKDE